MGGLPGLLHPTISRGLHNRLRWVLHFVARACSCRCSRRRRSKVLAAVDRGFPQRSAVSSGKDRSPWPLRTLRHGSLSRAEEEHRAARDLVCAVQPVDDAWQAVGLGCMSARLARVEALPYSPRMPSGACRPSSLRADGLASWRIQLPVTRSSTLESGLCRGHPLRSTSAKCRNATRNAYLSRNAHCSSDQHSSDTSYNKLDLSDPKWCSVCHCAARSQNARAPSANHRLRGCCQ